MNNNLAVSSSKEILETMDNCTKCGICHSFCPVANVTKEFPGPKFTGPKTQRFRMIESLEELSKAADLFAQGKFKWEEDMPFDSWREKLLKFSQYFNKFPERQMIDLLEIDGFKQ